MDGILYLTEERIAEYARIRSMLEIRGTPIGPNDMWIAAPALVEDALLISANTREFAQLPEVRVQNWLAV
ncbi:PIN domain-containing protein [Steroidobacter denitrificans]|uniref:PIN domain-containing protein n=1 Tax=Steroidobacter denitrificans TaxID=465721 RepID=UPI0008371AC5|nr:PIN domain-containing protein [Steroidobacter denitrificans]